MFFFNFYSSGFDINKISEIKNNISCFKFFLCKESKPKRAFFQCLLKTFLSPMLWVVTMSKCHICPLCSQQSHDMWHRQTVLDVSTFSRKSHSQSFQRKYKNVNFFINYPNPLRQSRVEALPLLSHVNAVLGALRLL